MNLVKNPKVVAMRNTTSAIALLTVFFLAAEGALLK
jgi:hypothetical protein